MTRFLDLRIQPVGGGLAPAVTVCAASSIRDYQTVALAELQAEIRGQHVLIATHGFNVDRAAGIDCLANWGRLLQLPAGSAFVGLLWPGDSIWAHGLDYAEEPKVANDAGLLLAPFIDASFADAASISFASHSLGARVILETIANMQTRVRRAVIMAGAIDDNCLRTEYQDAAANIDTISILASRKDQVLSAAFPIGNFFAGIIAEGHPWWRAALGHRGHSNPRPENLKSPYEIPENWKYGHLNYLQIDQPPAPDLPIPTDVPPGQSPVLQLDASGDPLRGWQEAFSAAFASTRFR